MKFLFSFMLLLPLICMANSGVNSALSAALIGGTVAGVTAGTQYSVYKSLMLTELDGWKKKETDSTIVLESQCDVKVEMHLVGDHRNNYVLYGISNSTPHSAIIKAKEIEFIFNDGSSRFPGWKIEPSDSELKSGWWMLNYIPFPSKDEFANYDSLEVQIPLHFPQHSSCLIKAKFTKQKKILREEMSYTIFDINFDGGASIAQNGPTKYLGKPDSMFGISMNIFPHPNHGAGFVVLNESGFKNSKNVKIQSKFSEGANYKANATFLGLNYVSRHFINKRVTVNYEPALGFQMIHDDRDKDSGGSANTKSSSFALMHKLMLNWIFARAYAPNYQALDFTLGVGLTQIWVPSDRINGQNLNGERYGALLRFGMGF